MIVLGIETSCDETGVALYCTERGLLAQALHSQVAMHERYGGVVPELASRDHVRRLLPLTREVLAEAGLGINEVDAIAYTEGPGLAGALLVGAAVGTSMAAALDKSAIGIHHLEGHLLSPLLSSDPPAFPFVALLVSGGHTQLMRVDGVGRYALLGDTLDDAAGEAFSFSGLKTAVLTAVRRGVADEQAKADLAFAVQAAIVDVLVAKSVAALEETGLDTLVIAGGVSANRRLRTRLASAQSSRGFRAFFPEPALCTDNGAMIAFAGALRLAAGPLPPTPTGFSVRPRWALDELPPLAA